MQEGEAATHDMRQLRRMLDCLGGMRRDQGALLSGVGSLLFLRDALESVDAQWSKEFTDHLATLESASLATPGQILAMGDGYPALIVRTLDALELLVRSRLSQTPHGEAEGP